MKSTWRINKVVVAGVGLGVVVAALTGCAQNHPSHLRQNEIFHQARSVAESDRAAASMAQEISQSDEQSLPVLLTALQTAGFFIIDDKGTVLQKPSGGGTGQGLGFYDFEADGSLKLDTRGIRISLENLARTITKDTPQISASQFAESMLTDVRTHAGNSDNAYLRFWARLIIELGKYSAQPVDLMTTSASDVKLSVLQTSLLVRRLQGDIYTLKTRHQQTGMIHPPVFQRHSSVPALWKMHDVPLIHLVSDSSPGSLPCSVTGDEALILDAAANGLTFGNGKLMTLLEKIDIAGMGKGIGTLSKGLSRVNAVLSWGKLVAAVTMLDAEITVDNPPLIRTRNTIPGEKRLMTARIRSEVGKKQLLNCVRPALNIATGLDFNLPTEGPVGDTAIGWQFVDPKKDNKFVGLESPPGKNKNPLVQVTDKEGVSQMWLVGAPKYQPAANVKNIKKVTKTANVWVSVTLKSSKDFIQNWIDIGGAALGGLAGSPGAVAEIGFRLPYVLARATIPVIDIEPSPVYRPTNNDSFVFSGAICSLEMPFTVTGTGSHLVVTYKLVPSSAKAGTWTFSGSGPGSSTATGGGSYTIEGADSNTPRILTVEARGQTGHLDLVPLETDECNQP